jgi:hypothetical protein
VDFWIYIFGAPLTTVVAATIVCRYRQKRFSWGSLALSALVGNSITFASVRFYDQGWYVFTRDCWREPKGGWAPELIFVGFVAAASMLPALAVALYHQKPTRRPSVHAA